MQEEGDPNRNKKKPLGDLNHFCPVALFEKNVLWPGNPECAAKYREKVYYLSNDENRTKFLENPTMYLTRERPPQVTIVDGSTSVVEMSMLLVIFIVVGVFVKM